MNSRYIVASVAIVSDSIVALAHSPWASRPVVRTMPIAPVCQDTVIVAPDDGAYVCPVGARGQWVSRDLVCLCDQHGTDGGAL